MPFAALMDASETKKPSLGEEGRRCRLCCTCVPHRHLLAATLLRKSRLAWAASAQLLMYCQ